MDFYSFVEGPLLWIASLVFLAGLLIRLFFFSCSIIKVTALPFMTGYFLTHDTLDSISFLGDNMGVIHMLSGEVIILMAVFLYCSTRLNTQKCTGCASCVQNCPTETLESSDKGKLRVFTYSHFQCICCGSCVNVCPEDAAELRH